MNFKNLLLFSALILAQLIFIPSFLNAQSYSKPESVDFDTASGRYFISNVNSGRIQVRSNNGTLSSLTQNSISPAPYGIEFCNNKLYACCGSTVKVYNPSTGELLNNISVTGSTFLNGITHDNQNRVYVTDFSGKKIFRINEDNTVTTIISNTVDTPNGILFEEDQNRLVYVCWGSNAKIKSVSLITLNDSILFTTSLSNIDGICKDSQGNYYVSNWGAQSVVKFSSDFSASQTVVTSLNSPADIYYNLQTDTLAIPNSVSPGSVTFWHNADITTNINNSDKINFLVFPNPAQQQFQLHFNTDLLNQSLLELFSAEGKLVYSKMLSTNSKTEIIDVGSLPKGFYLIKVSGDENSIQTAKILVN
jgi:hypothetical protein